MVASKQPIPFDRAKILERFAALPADAGLSPEMLASTNTFFETVNPDCPLDPSKIEVPASDDVLNHDLFPRDEYFLNNEPGVLARYHCT
jgi:hypothetical protein